MRRCLTPDINIASLFQAGFLGLELRSDFFCSFSNCIFPFFWPGPKEPKGQGRVKIHGRGPGGSARRTGNSPSGLRHPGAVPRSRHRPLPIFTMRPPSGYNLCSTIPSLFFPFPFSLFPFCLFVFLSFCLCVSPSYYITIYLTFTTSTVGTRRGASASTFR